MKNRSSKEGRFFFEPTLLFSDVRENCVPQFSSPLEENVHYAGRPFARLILIKKASLLNLQEKFHTL